ncbi:hypothetical protein EDC01DRAFT_752816 [Geopyxis carbonaria]|nr:hypothetical protein EDC01DRAFT_752816 [Geopyxis carbonaria]
MARLRKPRDGAYDSPAAAPPSPPSTRSQSPSSSLSSPASPTTRVLLDNTNAAARRLDNTPPHTYDSDVALSDTTVVRVRRGDNTPPRIYNNASPPRALSPPPPATLLPLILLRLPCVTGPYKGRVHFHPLLPWACTIPPPPNLLSTIALLEGRGSAGRYHLASSVGLPGLPGNDWDVGLILQHVLHGIRQRYSEHLLGLTLCKDGPRCTPRWVFEFINDGETPDGDEWRRIARGGITWGALKKEIWEGRRMAVAVIGLRMKGSEGQAFAGLRVEDCDLAPPYGPELYPKELYEPLWDWNTDVDFMRFMEAERMRKHEEALRRQKQLEFEEWQSILRQQRYVRGDYSPYPSDDDDYDSDSMDTD